MNNSSGKPGIPSLTRLMMFLKYLTFHQTVFLCIQKRLSIFSNVSAPSCPIVIVFLSILLQLNKVSVWKIRLKIIETIDKTTRKKSEALRIVIVTIKTNTRKASHMSKQYNTSHSINSRLSLPHGKDISLDFSGGNVTSDAGVILLAELDARIGLTEQISSCFKDTRQPGKIIHSIQEMIQQRVFQISCGYENCNDAQTLRRDPALKIAVGKKPESDGDLSSQPTLSSLENSITPRELYRMGE